MKAGTAHKMVLNMISTARDDTLGYVYGNLMVNVVPKNEKLTQRAIGILEKPSAQITPPPPRSQDSGNEPLSPSDARRRSQPRRSRRRVEKIGRPHAQSHRAGKVQ